MNTENTLFRIFPAAVEAPEELTGLVYGNMAHAQEALDGSGQGELIMSREQLTTARAVVAGEFPADSVFGIDVDSGPAAVNLGVFPDQDASEIWRDPQHQCQYTFDLDDARTVLGA